MNKNEFVPVELARAQERLNQAERIVELRTAELEVHFSNDPEFGKQIVELAKTNTEGFKSLKDGKYIIGTIKRQFPQRCMSMFQVKALNYLIGALIRKNIAEGNVWDLEEEYLIEG